MGFSGTQKARREVPQGQGGTGEIVELLNEVVVHGVDGG